MVGIGRSDAILLYEPLHNAIYEGGLLDHVIRTPHWRDGLFLRAPTCGKHLIDRESAPTLVWYSHPDANTFNVVHRSKALGYLCPLPRKEVRHSFIASPASVERLL